MEAAMPVGFLSLANAIAAITLNALWQDALLVAAVWLLLRAWPRLNAATRYTVWTATLVAAIVVPVATTLPFVGAAAGSATASTSTLRTSHAASEGPLRHARTAAPATRHGGPVAQASPRSSLPARFRVALPVPVSVAIFLAWAALALFSLVRLAIGLARLEQLKRDALPLPVEYRDAMERWARANKGSRDVRLCVTDDVDVPVAVGLFDSMILIPRVLLERLSEAEVDQISLHELAHLRRADDWSNGLQRIAIALLAWNPAAQFVGQQLDLEREVACDDWALSLIGAVRPYALCLTKMAETSSWPRHPLPAPGVFATRKHISLRVERLLGAGRNIATTLAIGPAAAAVAVVGAMAIVIAFVAPSIAAPSIAAPVVVARASSKPLRPKEVVRYVRVAVVPSARPSAVPTARPRVVAIVRSSSAPSPSPTSSEWPLVIHVPAVKVHLDVPKMDITVPNPMITSDGKNCTGCDEKGVNWSGRDLHGAAYMGADFTGAKLVGTDFSGGAFAGVTFVRADLRNANFSGARLTGVDFRGARLAGANFNGATLIGCTFNAADLSHVDLSKAKTFGNDVSGQQNPH